MDWIRRTLVRLFWKSSIYFCMPLIGLRPALFQKAFRWILRTQGMNIGTPAFVAHSAYFDGTDYSLITLGDSCVISRDVLILTHDYSIQRYFASLDQPISGVYKTIGPVTIGRNVFIGARSVLLPGTSIGDNTVIGAGSVVRGTIDANLVVAGNPATKVCGLAEWGERARTRAILESNSE